jgi:hypothetical protein
MPQYGVQHAVICKILQTLHCLATLNMSFHLRSLRNTPVNPTLVRVPKNTAVTV